MEDEDAISIEREGYKIEDYETLQALATEGGDGASAAQYEALIKRLRTQLAEELAAPLEETEPDSEPTTAASANMDVELLAPE